VLVLAVHGVPPVQGAGSQAVADGQELAAVSQVQGIGDAAADWPEGVELAGWPEGRGAVSAPVHDSVMPSPTGDDYRAGVTVPGNSELQIMLGLAFMVACSYAAGRLHQWYKHALDRDSAFRDGYDRASRSLFAYATRAVRGLVTSRPASETTVDVGMERTRVWPASVTPISAAPSRHSREDAGAKTVRLKSNKAV
jgi:hypothetical protein